MNIFDTLKKLKDQERKQPMRIYQDEQTGQIIEESNNTNTMKQYHQYKYKNPAKLIHDSIL